MTQLQNQDPTSPMDANSFTSELVEFSSVEQQINTNTSLTQLIQLTQASDVTQSAALLGKQVTVQSTRNSIAERQRHGEFHRAHGGAGFHHRAGRQVATRCSR